MFFVSNCLFFSKTRKFVLLFVFNTYDTKQKTNKQTNKQTKQKNNNKNLGLLFFFHFEKNITKEREDDQIMRFEVLYLDHFVNYFDHDFQVMCCNYSSVQTKKSKFKLSMLLSLKNVSTHLIRALLV